jgi:serine/threonine protein kinase/WD40 repeat protein
MEMKVQADDDFADRLAQFYEQSRSLTGQKITHLLPTDETLDDELLACLDCLNLIDRVCERQRSRDSLLSRDPSAVSPDLSAYAPRQIRYFKIERELGRGGAGVVFLATDTRLRRKVALKVPHPQFFLNEDLRRRFIREAEVSARLDHPHIVRVHEVGNEGPVIYLASEYCDGPTLHQWRQAEPGPVAATIAATIVRDLAEAVDHAHRQAVIHRDIKPSNVLVIGSTVSSTTTPNVKLCDFGLAKVLEEDQGETRSGSLLGTPAYMSPEQASGKLRDVDTRTDIYALGCILFELICGRAPFVGDSSAAITLQVIHDEAPRIDSFRKDAPLDLTVITAKCLMKTKADRYQSARELALDLGRYLAGEPISARPIPWWERLKKSVVRHPATATAALLATILPIALLAMTIRSNAILFEKNREIVQRLYVADMRTAKQAIDDYRLDEARTLLNKYEPSLNTPDVRTLPWRLLAARMNENQVIEWKCHEGDIYSVDASPDGKLLATASRDGTACLWAYPSGRLVHRLTGHQRDVNQAIFSPDGQLLATCGDDGTVRLWEIATAKCRWSIQAHSKEAGCLAFHPNGTQLLSGSVDHSVRAWRVHDGTPIGEPLDLQHSISAVAFSKDGSSFVLATHEPRIARFQTESMQRVWPLTVGTNLHSKPRTLVIDPTMDRILTGGWGGEILEVDANGNGIHRSPRGGGVTSIRLMPGSDRFVVTRENGRVEFRELQSFESGIPLYASRSRVWDSRIMGPKRVAIACADGYLRQILLPSKDPHGVRTVARLDAAVNNLIESRDGKVLFAAGDNYLAIIDPNADRIIHQRKDFSTRIFSLTSSNHESLIATGEESGRVSLWEAETLTQVKERVDLNGSGQPPTGIPEALCFLRDRNALLIGVGETLVRWDFKSDTVSWRQHLGIGRILSIVELPDDQVIVSSADGLMGMKRTAAGYEELYRDNQFQPRSPICLASDNEYAFVGDRQGGLHRFLRRTGSAMVCRYPAGQGRYINGLSLSDSGKWMVLGSSKGEFCLVDTDQLSAISTTVFADARVLSTAFTVDEKTMFAGLSDGRIVAKDLDVFDWETFVFPSSPMKRMKSSPDGKLAIIVDEEEWLKLFQTNPLRRLPSWVGREFEEASFSPDGSEIILTHKDGIYRAFVTSLDDTPTLVRKLDVKTKEIDHLTHDRVVVRDQNDAIRIIELRENGMDVVIWKPDGALIERMALSGSRKLLALATTALKIHLIHLDGSTEEQLEVAGFVRSLVLSPDGRKVAMGDEHGSIHVFDIGKGTWSTPMHYLENVTVRAIAFADAGQTILTASNQGGIQLWNLATGEIVYELNTDTLFQDFAINPANGEVLACGRDHGNHGVLKMYKGIQVDK